MPLASWSWRFERCRDRQWAVRWEEALWREIKQERERRKVWRWAGHLIRWPDNSWGRETWRRWRSEAHRHQGTHSRPRELKFWERGEVGVAPEEWTRSQGQGLGRGGPLQASIGSFQGRSSCSDVTDTCLTEPCCPLCREEMPGGAWPEAGTPVCRAQQPCRAEMAEAWPRGAARLDSVCIRELCAAVPTSASTTRHVVCVLWKLTYMDFYSTNPCAGHFSLRLIDVAAWSLFSLPYDTAWCKCTRLHWFTYITSAEHLLRPRHCSRCWDSGKDKRDRYICCMDLNVECLFIALAINI